MPTAHGTFDVTLTPQSTTADAEAGLGRLSIAKTFAGDLTATSVGEMLTAGTQEKSSAAYVAVERVTGMLLGKVGTFALHHTGIMQRGAGSLGIHVVPDSGTGDLAGLTGSMSIDTSGGGHAYAFEYTLLGG